MLNSIKNYSIYNKYSLFKILYRQYDMVIVNTLYLFVAGKRWIGLMFNTASRMASVLMNSYFLLWTSYLHDFWCKFSSTPQ